MEKILAKSTGETLSEHTIHCLEAAEGIVNSLPFPEKRGVNRERRFHGGFIA